LQIPGLPSTDEPKIPNASQNAKEVETGQWLSVLNYLDE